MSNHWKRNFRHELRKVFIEGILIWATVPVSLGTTALEDIGLLKVIGSRINFSI